MGVRDLLRRPGPIVSTELPTYGSARAMIGAAARVDLTAGGNDGPRKSLQQPWQGDAWVYRDVIGEVRYGIDWLAAVMSRLRLHAAIVDNPREAPVDVGEVLSGDTKLDNPLPPGLIQDAIDAIEMLSGGGNGHGAILEPMTVNAEVPGECYLLGREDDLGGQLWQIRSTDELERNRAGKWVLRDSPAQNGTISGGEELDPERTYVARMWKPHPRWRALPDSPMRGVLDPCEGLLLKTRKMRVRDRARLSRGVLLVAQELTFENEKGEPVPFQQRLQDAMLSAVADESAPSSLVPTIARVPAERIKDGTAMQHVDVIDKDDQTKDGEDVIRFLARIVRGLDFPPEVVEGLGDVKFANAVAIDSTSFRYHVEPKAQRHVDNLSVGFLWPWLEALGWDPMIVRRIVIWYDPTEVVTNPNRLPDVVTAFDHAAASIEELRDAAGLVGDGPSYEELLMRAVVLGKIRQADVLTLAETGTIPPGGPVPVPPSTTGETQRPPALAAAAPALLALTAALSAAQASPWSATTLALDLDLRGRLTGACDAALRRSLDRAGARVVSRVRKDSALAARVAGKPIREVAAAVGRQALTDLGEDPDRLLDGAFDDIRALFLEWTTETWEQGLSASCSLLSLTYHPPTDEALAAAAPSDGTPDTKGLGGIDQIAARARFAADAVAGADGLVADLTAEARRRLFDPGFSDLGPGEGTPGLLVQPGTIRAAMARAGGASSDLTFSDVDTNGQAVNPSDGDPGMVATGLNLRGALSAAGVPQYAYRWQWGGSARPFPPHQELNGRIFSDQTHESLKVAEAYSSWLPATTYRPGDHKGCSCSTEYLLSDPFEGMSKADADSVRALQKTRNARGRFEAGHVTHPERNT